MRIRKVVSVLLYIMLALGAFAGWKFLFGKPTVVEGSDYTYVQTVAEEFVKPYMTIDDKVAIRSSEIAWIAPEAAEHLGSADSAVQTVRLVKAAKPVFSGDKAIVNVDTWVLSKKETEKDGKKIIIDVPRRFQVTVILQNDGKNQYFVEGLPLIREKGSVEVKKRTLDSKMAKVREDMMPVINAVIPGVFANNPSAISNFLADQSSINYYQGYKVSKIENVFVKESGKSYIVDVDVEVIDPVNQAKVSMRVNMIFIQKDGKYYVQKVS